MAWTKVGDQGHLATSQQTQEESVAKHVWVAVSDTPVTPVDAEYADDGINRIPRKGEAHPVDPSRKVKSVTPRVAEESDGRVYYVDVEYSNKAQTVVENPVDRPATYEWDGDESTEQWFTDCDPDGAKPFCNSSGERFDELRERDAGSDICVVTKNVDYEVYSPAEARTYKNKVNSDTVSLDGENYAPGKLKIKKIPAGPKQVASYTNLLGVLQQVEYREVRAIIQVRDEGWTEPIEDRGYNELITIGAKKQLKEIMKGKPPAKPDRPWPLDGSGRMVVVDGKTPPDATPATLVFYPYEMIPFAPLGFA